MNRHPYPTYKPSGLEWLGEIPAHWELLEIKRLSPVKRGASPRPIDDPNYFDDKGDYSWVRISDVTSSKRYLEKTTQRLSSLGKSLSVPLKPGALFLSIAGSVGKPIITRINCCIHDGFVYFPQFEGNSEFLYYIFASGQPYGGLGKLGTQLNLNTDTVGAIHIGYPSYEEQGKIVAYLDRETTRIDALIEKKQKQLELLQEKRSALISHAVTKGLDPNAKMKDSGIEWLGEIPSHWDVRRLRYLASGSLMYGANEAALEADPSFPRFVRITDISEDGSLRPETFKSLPSEIAEPYLLREGDILLARSGATVGKTFIYRKEWGKACFAGYLIRFPCNRDLLLPDFLFCFTQSHIYWSQVRRGTIQATIQNFSAEKYGEILLPLPPLTEQQTIVAYFNGEAEGIDILIEKIKKSITLLQEYRTSLISATVTGKINVRKEAT